MFDEKKINFELGNKQIEVRTGKLARQTSASVVIQSGNTVLLVTVCKSKEVRDGIDFFPLLVDFEEKHYSIGKIPGGYLRREGRASDKAILASRLMDRPIRPLFPEGFKYDVHVCTTTLSVDQATPPDTLAMLGAGFALELSGLPFAGPLGAVRVGLDENKKFILNPSEEEIIASDLDIVVAGTKDSVMMVEAGANFVDETLMADAIEAAMASIKMQCEKMTEFAKLCGVTEKETFIAPEINSELVEIISKTAKADLLRSIDNVKGKTLQDGMVAEAKAKVKEAIAAIKAERSADDALVKYLAENPNAVSSEFKNFEKKLLRARIAETSSRADGRKLDEVRPISVEIGMLPMVHGDGLFTRGDTQVMSILTLGTERLAKSLDGIDSETEKFYMHNYNFPAWSVGEVRPNRGPGRREIGHGALAERAIIPSLPNRDDFPYAIRIVSEIMASSGSTSMASVCGSSLALMDGGVPVKTPIAGVAMGLIKEGSKDIVLTDIQEREDFLGDMDFKVAGDANDITALQMDIKVQGISIEILRTALTQAKAGRLHILGKMQEVISAPKATVKEIAPRIVSFHVSQDKIGAVIGPGGKHIKWVIEETGAEVNIADDGKVSIYTTDENAGEEARKLVLALANGVQPGDVWEAKVTRIIENVGAVAELFPGTTGLIHISQIANERVEDISQFLNPGDELTVKVLEVDTVRGRIGLSRKALLEQSTAAAA